MAAENPVDSPYPRVGERADFPALEEEILASWDRDHTFEASVEARAAGEDGSNEYVFYDGPPFANGQPHYGHLLTGYVKDAVPRYQTMRGRRVERRWGWDTHGLPVEMQIEKELGVSGAVQIEEYGIDRFNARCRALVADVASDWQRFVRRQARWVDMGNAYRTLDLPYMESVIWALKQLHDKGLMYEGYKVLAYCWECETPLSNFETRMDDAYRERQDPAVTVLFELDPVEGEPDGVPLEILVWTTTPWTLPSNLALAVGPDMDYAVLEEEGHRYVIGEATMASYTQQLERAVRVGTMKGEALVGRTYRPLFPYFRDTPNAFRVLAGDFVSTDEGTGTVHIAPGFGQDDQRVSEANGIPVVVPVDRQGKFTDEVPDYAGLQVFDANPRIIKDLKAAGAIVKHETYAHSYPHCWRTDTPLIYKAVSSWFIQVTAVNDRMLELNQEINWVPEHVKDGAFGKWIENLIDWPISRNRYWGTPIPVWKSDDPAYPRVDVYGSLDELERDFGVRLDDLHRPGVDELTRPNPDDPTGKSTMRRVPEVLDCWFDSGSMPFAQVHYPFENREWFENHFPADFICEYVGQTRGWFYTLHTLSTTLFDRPAFQTCLAHGVLLGDDGQKLSKRLRNFPDPDQVFARYGADAMRWYLLSSPILRGGDGAVEERAIAEASRHILQPIWNAWHFFTLYANTDGYRATFRADASGVLDRYILAKTHELVVEVTARMDAYDLFSACGAVTAFIDALNNWYIRRSRDRFWHSDTDAFDTLATVMRTLTQVTAPLLPLVSEYVYRGLTGEPSVHLADWPDPATLPADPELVAAMDLAREVCSAALSVRKAQNRRVRLPLATLTVAGAGAASLEGFAELIADEVNVKTVDLRDEVGDLATGVLQVTPAVVGPRLGPDTQKVLRAAKAGEWSQRDDGRVDVAGHVLEPSEFTLRLTPSDEDTSRALSGRDTVIVLDVVPSPELEAEGVARDVVRLVQEARKKQGLHVSDRIHLVIEPPDDVRPAVAAHRDYVMAETLARDLVLAETHIADAHRGELSDGRHVHIGLHKVD
ncbi:MAG: isoleucyl-tRNA synthetase [Actinomycetota bacterium]|nr:isoleucyl-tRNA synthetase [Actinomycetota bacterium]